MKPRTLRYVVGALVALVALYLGTVWLGDGAQEPGAEGDLARALAQIDTSDLRAIRIEAGADTLEIRREGGSWRVGEHTADSAAVVGLRSALAELAVSGLASSNPSNHARLGLDPDRARSVRLSGESWGPVALEVGDAGPYARSAYVRVEGSDRAWIARGGIRGATPTALAAWQDTTGSDADTTVVEPADSVAGG